MQSDERDKLRYLLYRTISMLLGSEASKAVVADKLLDVELGDNGDFIRAHLAPNRNTRQLLRDIEDALGMDLQVREALDRIDRLE